MNSSNSLGPRTRLSSPSPSSGGALGTSGVVVLMAASDICTGHTGVRSVARKGCEGQ
ncbi:hypothetical protein ACFFX0_28525 [Citricoccus parietis]|uniref:Uncharacterized protein n=1 Tax=Citricoccus parietis TaxID=592307 RepID=A0ABV5FSR3_9MICC